MVIVMEIKYIPRDEYFRIKYDDLDANMFDDGRMFCATSSDGQWCCVGVIVDHKNNFGNENPLLQVNDVYKRSR